MACMNAYTVVGPTNDGFDLAAVAHDALVLQQAGDVLLAVARHAVEIEALAMPPSQV
jgi:hypothetical protein